MMYAVSRWSNMPKLDKNYLIFINILAYYASKKIGCLEEGGPLRVKLRKRVEKQNFGPAPIGCHVIS